MKTHNNGSSAANLQLLLDLSSRINSDLDLDSLLLNIIEAAKEMTGSEASSVLLLDEKKEELVLSIPTGSAKKLVSGRRFSKHKGIAGWVIANREPLIVNDAPGDPRFLGDFNPELFTTRTLVCVPLLNKNSEPIGALEVINKSGQNSIYTDEDLPLFQALSNHAAIAIENARLRQESKVREEAILQSLKEKKMLLSEIHHRVKNNLAVISALMELQSGREGENRSKTILLENLSRIRTMAIIHEHLYQSKNLTKLNYHRCLKQMINSIIDTMPFKTVIHLQVRPEPVQLNINQALPCSLIINEVMTNIIMHSFADRDEGTVEIELTTGSQHVTLSLRDNGADLPEDLRTGKKTSLGLQLIDVLARQLSADYSYDTTLDGNCFVLRFRITNSRGPASNLLLE